MQRFLARLTHLYPVWLLSLAVVAFLRPETMLWFSGPWIVWALRLEPGFAVGIILVASCPGGVASNMITYLAGAHVIPVGDAFFLADTDGHRGYRADTRFDFKAARPPAVPDQTHSLHKGWSWLKQKDGSQKLAMDGHHANTAGVYLGRCVWYEVLFGASAVGNAFVPPGLDATCARFLQETAHRAVQTEARR